MSAVLKMFIGLLVIVCLAKFIEMAPQETKEGETGEKLLKDISEQIKNAFTDENVKKFIEGASNALSEGAKTLEDHMKDWKQKLDQMSEKKA